MLVLMRNKPKSGLEPDDHLFFTAGFVAKSPQTQIYQCSSPQSPFHTQQTGRADSITGKRVEQAGKRGKQGEFCRFGAGGMQCIVAARGGRQMRR